MVWAFVLTRARVSAFPRPPSGLSLLHHEAQWEANAVASRLWGDFYARLACRP